MNENKKPQNPNAFPSDYETTHNGMTLRDYFANSAMQSLIIKVSTKQISVINKIKIFFAINGWETTTDVSAKKISNASYDIADAMLKQREQ